MRSDLPEESAKLIEDSLYTSQEDWVNGSYQISGPGGNLPMHPREVLRYSQGIRYFAGAPNRSPWPCSANTLPSWTAFSSRSRSKVQSKRNTHLPVVAVSKVWKASTAWSNR